ncbi:MAG: glycosyltransferase family 32 protein [Candidatus Saccharimonadales bacterium]
MEIPKTIHYIWMGGKKKPYVLRRCIKMWHKRLKGYKIIEWNEKNFPIDEHPFAKRAYEAKQWAFVSDYVRSWVIYNHGGVYFDTDIMVIRPIDDLLKNDAFVGFESKKYPFTAVFGATKHHPFVRDMLSGYDDKKMEYDFKDNNTISASEILIKKYGCKANNKEQLLKTGIRVYSDGVLCSPSLDSYTVHLFYGGWKNSGRNMKNIWREVLRGFILTSPRRIKMYYFFLRKKG